MISMTRIMSIRLYHIFYVYFYVYDYIRLYYLIVNAPLLIVPNNDRVKI